MIINSIDDIKNMELYLVSIEYWDVVNTEKYYEKLLIKSFDFKSSYVSLDYFEEFSDELIGKDNNQFLQWLLEKSEEEGYEVKFFLEGAGIYLSELEENTYDKKTKQKLTEEEEEKLWDTGNFELANGQPFISDEDSHFTTLKEAKDYLGEICPFVNDSDDKSQGSDNAVLDLLS